MNQEEYLLSDQESFEEEEQEINFGFDAFPEYSEEYVDNQDNESESDSVSYVMVGRKNKKKIQKKKQNKGDTGYRRIKMGNNQELMYFATTIVPGRPIRDAIYGAYMNEDLVGSNDESLYFKVIFAGNGCNQQVDHLFYDNPEQFENHMSTKVEQKIKEKWSNIYRYALEDKQKKVPRTVNNIKIK